MIWKTSPSTSFKALYGRAHRSPNTFERDYDDQGTANSQVANLNLKAESIDTFELVLDKRMSENISLQTSLYQWRLQNLIVAGEYPLNPVLSQYQNSDPITAKGLELSFDQKWANGNRLRSSLAYQQVVRNNGERLANSPRFLGKLNFSGLLPKTSVRVGYEMQYMSNRLSRDGADLGSYWLSNLNFTNNTWVKDLDISLGIYNLFDHHYFDSGSRVTQQDALEQDSRSVRLKLDYHF